MGKNEEFVMLSCQLVLLYSQFWGSTRGAVVRVSDGGLCSPGQLGLYIQCWCFSRGAVGEVRNGVLCCLF